MNSLFPPMCLLRLEFMVPPRLAGEGAKRSRPSPSQSWSKGVRTWACSQVEYRAGKAMCIGDREVRKITALVVKV